MSETAELATETWCQDYLRYFYYDSNNPEQLHAKFFQSDRPFTRLAETFVLKDLKKRPCDLFGVIINYTAPKANSQKASHRYSCTFFIIDPSYNNPAHSIGVVLFFNEIDPIIGNIKVGDVVALRDFTVGDYNNFPQITGALGKSRVYICRNSHNYHDHGLYSFSIPSNFAPVLEWEGIQSLLKTQADPTSTWKYYSLMTQTQEYPEAAVDLMTKYAIQANYYLAQWTFSRVTLADNTVPSTPHCNIHDFLHLRALASGNTHLYESLQPQGITSRQSTDLFEKCDIIALVLRVQPGDETRGISFIVWDGTSGGTFQASAVSSDCHGCIQAAFHQSLTFHQLFHGNNNQNSVASQHPVEASLVDRHRFLQIKEELQPQLQTLTTFPAETNPDSINSNSSSNANGNSSSNSNNNSNNSTTVDFTYLGVPLQIHADVPSFNHYLARIEPGTWVRIRNLRVYNDAQDRMVKGRISFETHIVALEHYFWDAMDIAKQYIERVRQVRQVREQPAPAHPQPPRKVIEVNEKGDPFLPLALFAFREAPMKAACFGRIVQWYPTNPEHWTQLESNTRTRRTSYHRTFLFSLQLSDRSFTLPVILYGPYAEEFLGVTAEDFFRYTDVREQVVQRLEAVKESKQVFDLYLQSYLVPDKSVESEKEGYDDEEAEHGSSTAKRLKKSHPTTMEKRFAICHSQLPKITESNNHSHHNQ